MQLAAFTDNSFVLGHSAMLVNEGLPALPRHPAGEGPRPGRPDASASSGWPSRARATTSGRACPTSSSASWSSGPREVLCTDPYVTVDDTLLPLEEVLERCRRARHRRSAQGLPRPRDRQARRRRVEPARQRARRYDARRLRRHPRLQRGGGDRPGPRPHLRGRRVRVRGARRRRLRGGHAPCPVVEAYAGRRRRGCACWSTPTAGDRRNAIRYGIDQVSDAVVVVTMADGSDDPRQIDAARPAGRARRRGRGRLALLVRRPAGRRAAAQGPDLARGRPVARHRWPGSAPGTRPTASRPTPPTSSARSASTAAAASRSASS